MAKNKTSRFGANVVSNVQKRQREASSYGYLSLPKDLKMFKESEGRIRLDVIPYIISDAHHPDGNADEPDAANPGNPWYKKPIWVHRSIGAGNESVVCPKTHGKKCPICEHRDQQFKEGVDKADVQAKAQLRNLYLVIPIKHKEYEEKLHLWDISNGNFQEELDAEIGENPENGRFPDPEDGFTLSIRFSEEVFNRNKYFKASRIDFEERDGYDPEIMEEAPNLDEMVNILSYKELEKMFLEIPDEEEEDDKPKKSSTKDEGVAANKFRKKGSKVKEEEPEEEPEEEEKPKSSSGGMKRKILPKSNGKAGKEECPKGYKFGKDWDEYDDCDECPVFEACGKKNEQG